MQKIKRKFQMTLTVEPAAFETKNISGLLNIQEEELKV